MDNGEKESLGLFLTMRYAGGLGGVSTAKEIRSSP
jgi:hypothetical protein